MKTKIKRENRFDVDGGYITRSPCLDCALRPNLPDCAHNCRTLSQLQALLIGTISCSSQFSEYEAYPLSI